MLEPALLLAVSLIASSAPTRDALLDSLFVFRPQSDVAAAEERTGGPALEILLTALAKPGDRFFVVLPREKRVLGATLKKIVENHADYPGPIGHLFPDDRGPATDAATWTALRQGRFGPALVVRGDAPPALDRIGTVSDEPKARERLHAGRMQPLLSSKVRAKVLRVRGVTAPDGRRWELVVAEPVDAAKREPGVWQAGALFEREDERRLIAAETGLSDVVSVSDLDDDGVLELVVQLGPSYVVRLFDGTRFLTRGRVLEVWEF